MYNKFIIHYYSGTGNFLRIARDMAKEAEEKDIDIIITPVEKYNYSKNSTMDDNSSCLFGLFMPTHGFTAS